MPDGVARAVERDLETLVRLGTPNAQCAVMRPIEAGAANGADIGDPKIVQDFSGKIAPHPNDLAAFEMIFRNRLLPSGMSVTFSPA